MSVFGAAEDIDAAVKVVMAEADDGSGRGKISIEIITEKKEAMPYLVQAFNEMMSKLSAGRVFDSMSATTPVEAKEMNKISIEDYMAMCMSKAAKGVN